MSGESPAARVARLKITYPLRTIRALPAADGGGWLAERPERATIWAMTAADLEHMLHQAETGGRPCAPA